MKLLRIDNVTIEVNAANIDIFEGASATYREIVRHLEVLGGKYIKDEFGRALELNFCTSEEHFTLRSWDNETGWTQYSGKPYRFERLYRVPASDYLDEHFETRRELETWASDEAIKSLLAGQKKPLNI